MKTAYMFTCQDECYIQVEKALGTTWMSSHASMAVCKAEGSTSKAASKSRHGTAMQATSWHLVSLGYLGVINPRTVSGCVGGAPRLLCASREFNMSILVASALPLDDGTWANAAATSPLGAEK